MKGWKGTLPVPWHSPVFAPRAVDAGAPKAPVAVPPKGVEEAPPNGFDVVVVVPPKAGLAAPNKPPPVFDEPKEVFDVGAGEPNPPKPLVPDVAVPDPNRLPPVVAAVPPNPLGFAPNALFCALPKPGDSDGVSSSSSTLRRAVSAEMVNRGRSMLPRYDAENRCELGSGGVICRSTWASIMGEGTSASATYLQNLRNR
jgi:hypothetical protein